MDAHDNVWNAFMKKRPESAKQIVRFRDSDEDYLAWLHNNPNGFVANDSYKCVVLHKVSCTYVCPRNAGRNRQSRLTTHMVVKYCSTNIAALQHFADYAVDWPTDNDYRCHVCNPRLAYPHHQEPSETGK